MADERAATIAVMADEAGKTAHEADPEVSEAIDFARYYGDEAVDARPTCSRPTACEMRGARRRGRDRPVELPLRDPRRRGVRRPRRGQRR